MRIFVLILSLLTTFSFGRCSSPEMKVAILINHVGYETGGSKNFVFQTNSMVIPHSFKVVDLSGKEVYNGSFEQGGQVDQWHTGKAYSGNFTDFNKSGQYQIQVEFDGQTYASESFDIQDGILAESCLPLLLQGFKSIHPAEVYENWDSNIPFHGDRKDRVDVRGGWYDASGDVSKYLTHLNYSNFMAPQQTPMVVWGMLESADYWNEINPSLAEGMLKEAIYGADFLVRMQDPAGYFYTTIFDNWSKDETRREICAYKTSAGERTDEYQAAFREGAGMAIAALARASKTKEKGEYNSKKYLQTAIKGYDHLLANNLKYCDDGKENIIDDYCALMAATELYLATNDAKYLEDARKRMASLTSRISDDANYNSWWRADDTGNRPFFHAADAGLPIVSLCRFLTVETEKANKEQAIAAIQASVDFELGITNEVVNPFGYPRQYVKAVNETSKRGAFFIPHQNETGYWWQGENARLASLASAVNMAAPYLKENQKSAAKELRTNALNWVLGLNPYDICMMQGVGRNNPSYKALDKEWNYDGGVANGITAGFVNENDIAFLPKKYENDYYQNWRWPEQWIPHAAWLIIALSSE